ncbi:YidC/Oxa1 family membrane protein insertase [Lysobacter niastensis]|uniref:Membrane protein insertase YidC n=1 Tax=Lysobacter niastensis TaxID=380629 RepID=A0ABU1W5T2_9GAMM|nr:membrane protein insertase YidC [Lysobacter niastensis]MDR7132921.1 YidC/Oxa1 family membrane protein insertase [Lysobacter niastensis]
MNQTRVFLIIAWLMVATLLWMEWGKEKSAAQAPAPTVAATAQVPGNGNGSVPSVAGAPSVPGVPMEQVGPAATSNPGNTPTVTVTTDVLKVTLEGGELHRADLLKYPSTADANSAPVRLFDDEAAHYFVAQSGWVSQGGAAPSHEQGFRVEGNATEFKLADGAQKIDVPFVWTGANGVTIRRTYTFDRGNYVVRVRDEVVNAGSAPWQGYVYRQFSRVPRALVKKGPMSAEQYSFQGAAWYSAADKYEKRKYDDFVDDGTLDKQVTGGWIGMLQHHFFSAWIPGSNDTSTFSLATPTGAGGTQYLIRELGPGVNVAPGAKASTEARLWVGPKLVKAIDAQNVPGLDRAVDFSSYSLMATLAGWLFWVLEQIYRLVGNWGWSIVGLVLLIKLAMFPLSAAQYKSMAKMRKFQPRMAQLKERYGDDKQKLQMAMMELYKKEKINPVGGCLPILLQMPVFLALYWMLSESVELRHAPWIGWITDLTSRDPFFVLPLINVAVMWFTQKLNPTTGMDPMQAKMMQFMPLVFGVMFAFFPAGLVLYWVTNGALGLLQQWWMIKRYSEEPVKV